MTASPRPNLGGLFNGSTPPERSSSIAEALGPRGVRLSAVSDPVGRRDPHPAAGPTSTQPPAVERRKVAPATSQSAAVQELHRSALGWLDPIKAVEHYFAFLHTLLDANQRLALSMTTTLVSLPQRARNWR